MKPMNFGNDNKKSSNLGMSKRSEIIFVSVFAVLFAVITFVCLGCMDFIGRTLSIFSTGSYMIQDDVVFEPPKVDEEDDDEPKFTVSIDNSALGKSLDGESYVLIITYKYTNNSLDLVNSSFAKNVDTYAEQSGVILNMVEDELEGTNYYADVEPGDTVSVDVSYKLKNIKDAYKVIAYDKRGTVLDSRESAM